MTFASYVVVKLLAREARRCANTQIREVVVAYYHFIEEREQESLLEAENDVRQHTHMTEGCLLHNNNPLQKIINWLKRI